MSYQSFGLHREQAAAVLASRNPASPVMLIERVLPGNTDSERGRFAERYRRRRVRVEEAIAISEATSGCSTAGRVGDKEPKVCEQAQRFDARTRKRFKPVESVAA